MSENEKKIAQNLSEALAVLPESKKEYLLGFAEGVAAMAESKKKDGKEG